MKVSVTLIIPLFNAELYIGTCLDSIQNQSYRDFEVLIIDDGSIDSSADIVKDYVEKDGRIKYYFQENQGAAAARNKGLTLANGEHIFFVDADDWLETNFLESFSPYFYAYDFAICGYLDHSRYARSLEIHDFDLIKGEKLTLGEEFFQGTAGVPWGKMYKRSILEDNNLLFNSNFLMSEDLDFNLRYIQFIGSFKIINAYLYNYNRLNDGSITSKIGIGYLESYLYSNNKIYEDAMNLNISKDIVNNWIANRMVNYASTTTKKIAIDSSLKFKDKVKLNSNFLSQIGSKYNIHVFVGRLSFLNRITNSNSPFLITVFKYLEDILEKIWNRRK